MDQNVGIIVIALFAYELPFMAIFGAILIYRRRRMARRGAVGWTWFGVLLLLFAISIAVFSALKVTIAWHTDDYDRSLALAGALVGYFVAGQLLKRIP